MFIRRISILVISAAVLWKDQLTVQERSFGIRLMAERLSLSGTHLFCRL